MRTIQPTAEQRAQLIETRHASLATQQIESEHHRKLLVPMTLDEAIVAGINECRNFSYVSKVVKEVRKERKITRLTAPIGLLCQNRNR